MPIKHGVPLQRHWQALEEVGAGNPWKELRDELNIESREIRERHYKEFVTFLPYVQRFLYGSTAGQESATGEGRAAACACSAATTWRACASTFEPGEAPRCFDVAHVALYFFLDADIAILAFEMYADDIPLDRAQDTLFRFGRAYPAYWERNGHGGNCPHSVEWLDAGRRGARGVGFRGARQVPGVRVARYRTPCLAHHWDFLLQPLVLEYPGPDRPAALPPARVLPHAVHVVSRRGRSHGAHARGLRAHRHGHAAGRAGHAAVLIVHARGLRARLSATIVSGGARASASPATRASSCTGHTFSLIVGRHDDYFFSGRETGLLGQFRHQYFLLFLIAHFHKAALVSMSDELAVAMNRLTVGDTESVKHFKRTIRQMMEVFLRFTHRYWFHEISNQASRAACSAA